MASIKKGKWWKRQQRRKRRASAAELISGILDHHHVVGEVRERRIVTDWERLVGPRVASRSWPNNVHNKVLYVRVSNSAWLQELTFLKDDMVKNINRKLGDPPLLADIRFVIGGGPKATAAEVSDTRALQDRAKLRRAPVPAPATGEHLLRIREETDSIEDPELRAIIFEARRLLDN